MNNILFINESTAALADALTYESRNSRIGELF